METVNKSDIEKILKKLWKKDDGKPSENRIAFNEALQKVQIELDTLEKKEANEMRTVNYRGYVVRSDDYNALEFYETPPKRIFGVHGKHWTYTDHEEFPYVLPLEIMPNLTLEDEPVEVILDTKVLVINK